MVEFGASPVRLLKHYDLLLLNCLLFVKWNVKSGERVCEDEIR